VINVGIEIVQLGKKQGYPVTDKQEFHMFLSYQHEVRNVIFHQDIPEFIIISVEWFFGLINDQYAMNGLH
jgi:hypothetical protein